jgi:hypothetical protein
MIDARRFVIDKVQPKNSIPWYFTRMSDEEIDLLEDLLYSLM